MEINNTLDMELSNMIKAELKTLQKYVEMFDTMTYDEKYELNQWLVNGHSVNSNGDYLYGENGCLLDFISASRINEDMVQNPDHYIRKIWYFVIGKGRCINHVRGVSFQILKGSNFA